MVSPISQAVLRQLRLRIEVDPTPSPGSPAFRPRRRLKMKGKELELLPPELFLLNGEIEVLDLGPEREACLFYHLDQVSVREVHLECRVHCGKDRGEGYNV